MINRYARDTNGQLSLENLGPVTPPTLAQVTSLRRLVAGKPDGRDTLAALGLDGAA